MNSGAGQRLEYAQLVNEALQVKIDSMRKVQGR